MGISTYQSYCGAQIFDAIGLTGDFVRHYFTGTATTIEGAGLAEIAEETLRRHRDAFGRSPILQDNLEIGGDYQFRLRGEAHVWRSETVSALQHAARGNAQDKYREFSRLVNDTEDRYLTIRSLFRIKTAEEDGRVAVPLAEVEPAKEIVRRFSTGAMSLRLDQPRGAHHARHRHEPDRRQVEHRRGRRGVGPLQAPPQRRLHALGDQAGRLGPLRRHRRVPRQLGHDADQDGAGRQARRGRPVARPQGRRDHRARAPFDAGRRPDLAAAAPTTSIRSRTWRSSSST